MCFNSRRESPLCIQEPHIAATNGKEVISMLQEDSVELRARCDPELRKKLKEAAEEAVRSMSAEAAYRLEKSFERDEAVRGTSLT